MLSVLSSDPSFLPSSHLKCTHEPDQLIPAPENSENVEIEKIAIPENPEIPQKSEMLENSDISENFEVSVDSQITETSEIFDSEALENSDQGTFVSSIYSKL